MVCVVRIFFSQFLSFSVLHLFVSSRNIHKARPAGWGTAVRVRLCSELVTIVSSVAFSFSLPCLSIFVHDVIFRHVLLGLIDCTQSMISHVWYLHAYVFFFCHRYYCKEKKSRAKD